METEGLLPYAKKITSSISSHRRVCISYLRYSKHVRIALCAIPLVFCIYLIIVFEQGDRIFSPGGAVVVPELQAYVPASVEQIRQAIVLNSRRIVELEIANNQLKKRLLEQDHLVDHYVVIPYRNRLSNLKTFEDYMSAYFGFYNDTKNRFTVIVVEQGDLELFNRGKLINIGYEYARKLTGFSNESCLAIHDVDMVPFPGLDYIECQEPRHLAYRLQRYNFQMMYKEFFGGVTSLSVEHYRRMNGFSNLFVGWGAEDDNLFDRAIQSKSISDKNEYFYRNEHSDERRMFTIHSDKDERAPKNDANLELLEEFKRSMRDFREEGLNTLEYSIVNTTKYQVVKTTFGVTNSLDVIFLSVNWTYPPPTEELKLKKGETHKKQKQRAALIEQQRLADLETRDRHAKASAVVEAQNRKLQGFLRSQNTALHHLIVVPFRNGLDILFMFLDYMLLYLGRFGEYNKYHILIVEQGNYELFNRGKLANIGLVYGPDAIKEITMSSCVFVHNMDIVPLLGVDYVTCEGPRSMSLAVQDSGSIGDTFVSKKSFQGVSSMALEMWQRVNGFSNKYANMFGGENFDLFNRCVTTGLISQPDSWILDGGQPGENRYFDICRVDVPVYPPKVTSLQGETDYRTDGMNDIQFSILGKNSSKISATRFGRVYTMDVHHIIVDW
mmetsp:Transcript_31120/g.49864  ORF Transcript_31120/g.49864 Transcript_31120/m.49864 type:complete len:668 (+) Transcript_31120:434-2437(+)